MISTDIAVYGIRHHGPGSARSLRAALAGQRPDIVLIEGPPEADDLVALAADPEMRPPVALLGYVPGEPRQAAFWPFAVFSPEWQAITYALEAGVPVRFCDLPAAHQLARKAAREEEQPEPRRRTDPVSDLAAAAGGGIRRPAGARPAEGEGRDDLGAADLRAAVLRVGLRGGHPLPRLVRPLVLVTRPAHRAVARPGRCRPARRRRPGVIGAR